MTQNPKTIDKSHDEGKTILAISTIGGDRVALAATDAFAIGVLDLVESLIAANCIKIVARDYLHGETYKDSRVLEATQAEATPWPEN